MLAVGLPWLAARGVPIQLDGGFGQKVAGVLAAAALSGLLGVAVAALVRNQVAVVVGALLWFLVIEGILPAVLGAPTLPRWLPGGAAAALADPGGRYLSLWAGSLLLAGYGLVLAAIGSRLTSAATSPRHSPDPCPIRPASWNEKELHHYDKNQQLEGGSSRPPAGRLRQHCAAPTIAAADSQLPVPQARYCGKVDAYRIRSCAEAILPATPLGRQLGWVLDQLGGEAATLTEAAVREHVSAEFLTLVMPPKAVIGALQGTPPSRDPSTWSASPTHPGNARPWPSSKMPPAAAAQSRSASPPASRP